MSEPGNTEPSSTDQPDRAPSGDGGPARLVIKAVATVAAFAVLVVGAYAITKDDSSAAATGVQNAPAAADAPGAAGGGRGGGMRPGMGAAVTGPTLDRLAEVTTAKYPGTVERALKLPDGSYLVHVITSDGSGEVRVLVSADFAITGTQEGGRPGGPPGAPPAGDQSAPSGAAPSSAS